MPNFPLLKDTNFVWLEGLTKLVNNTVDILLNRCYIDC